MSRSKLRVNTCEVCGNTFKSNRVGALCCSTACRVKKSRAIKSGEGRNWYAVRPEYQEMAAAIHKNVRPETYEGIKNILYQHGAIAAEWAIVTCWNAMQDYKYPVK